MVCLAFVFAAFWIDDTQGASSPITCKRCPFNVFHPLSYVINYIKPALSGMWSVMTCWDVVPSKRKIRQNHEGEKCNDCRLNASNKSSSEAEQLVQGQDLNCLQSHSLNSIVTDFKTCQAWKTAKLWYECHYIYNQQEFKKKNWPVQKYWIKNKQSWFSRAFKSEINWYCQTCK